MQNEIEGWAAWHPKKGFDLQVNILVNRSIEDAMQDAKANNVFDPGEWEVAKVKVTKIT